MTNTSRGLPLLACAVRFAPDDPALKCIGASWTRVWLNPNVVTPGYVFTMKKRAGLPQSRALRTIERITRDGDILTIEITHVDRAP